MIDKVLRDLFGKLLTACGQREMDGSFHFMHGKRLNVIVDRRNKTDAIWFVYDSVHCISSVVTGVVNMYCVYMIRVILVTKSVTLSF